MNKTIGISILAAAALCASGCNSTKRLSDYKMPVESTPAYEIQQLGKCEALVRDAQRYEVAGKPDLALIKYEAAIGEYYENPTAWHNAGILWAKKGENLKAANAFKTASELAPSDPRPLYELGALWEGLGYLDDASRWYGEALERDPYHQNSLRHAILVDDLRHKLNATTAERLKIAIVAERQPWWINRFQRIHQLMTEREPNTYTTDDLTRPPADVEPMSPDSISLPGVEPRRPAQPRPAAPGQTPQPTLPGTPNPGSNPGLKPAGNPLPKS